MLSISHLRTAALWLSLGLAGAFIGCSAQPLLYSRTPVDADGATIPLARATKILFEDGSSYTLTSQETLSLRKDSLRASGSRFGTAIWSLAQVEGIEWRDDADRLHWTKVRTPEDLRSFVTLPPLERIVMKDGQTYRLDEPPSQARLDPTGLYLLLTQNEDWENATQLELAEVESVLLHEPNLAGATIRSPKFWLAAAAAGVAILLVSRDGDPKRTAVR